VLLVTSDTHAMDSVRLALSASERFELAGVCRTLSEIEDSLQRAPVSAVLVDVDGHSDQVLARLAPFTARFPATRFVVLGGAVRSDLLVQAMQVGARHFLEKASIEAELTNALGRLVPQGYAGPTGSGTLITVLSASGGSGATTIAVNLANELGLETSAPALLIDLDAFYGAAAPYLGVKAQYGVADVLEYEGHIDGHLIQTTAAEHSEALQVLLSPCSISFSEPKPLRWEALGDALEACKCAFRYTVIDAPRVPMDVAAELARASRLTLVVFQLLVTDIHLARASVAALVERGVSRSRLMPLANRYSRRSPIGLKEAREALGETELTLVSGDFRSTSKSINYGRPLAEVAPRSPARKDIRRLATDAILKEEETPSQRSPR
jgi:pilus assembly protein CpaE